jgi:hypothetical protein
VSTSKPPAPPAIQTGAANAVSGRGSFLGLVLFLAALVY